MSELRDAIKQEITVGRGAERTADAVLVVVEAYLREHDAQVAATASTAGLAAGRALERERIRQRIEAAALARYKASHSGFALLPDGHAEAVVLRDIAWVLEALGGTER